MLLANRNHAALILSFLPTSPSPNPNDKLQVRLSWNVSPSCNLLPMFLSNSATVPCDLNKENPDLKLEYKFLEGVNTLPYEELDFASGLLDVLGMIQNQSEIRLFELQPSRSSIKFIGSNCSEIGTNELGCFSELDMNVIFLIRMVEKNMINIYLRNDPFNYEIENKDQVVFTRYGSSDPFDGWYNDQYVDINFQNGTNFKLNFINYTANFWYPDMAGQTIEVHFVAEFSGDFSILGSLTSENFGLEINQTIFELVDIDKKGFAEYQTEMSPSSIRILSQSIMIEIPFKNKILNVTKLNATTLKIEWTKPMGKYDAIKLVCEAEDFVDSNTYSEDSTSGNCVHPLAFSGQLTKIVTFVKKSDEFYKTDKKVLIIDLNEKMEELFCFISFLGYFAGPLNLYWQIEWENEINSLYLKKIEKINFFQSNYLTCYWENEINFV
ncbi:hypothetical protein BpHYR1_010771 [Brachionus plicatilis]|uniref:Uncharacterized protein n=1 Tax=Brachionus plicatilis TaxID=10195 RepID=A0A3M7Q5P8_BRAPC|nr:hypothetical protein BpHYR1_010771 [Brachionus plicatilis]